MLIERIPIIIPDAFSAPSTATIERAIDFDPSGRIIRIKQISVSNLTTSSKICYWGIMIGTEIYYYKTLGLDSAGIYYVVRPDILIPSECKVVLQLITPTAGDKYRILVNAEEEVYSNENDV